MDKWTDYFISQVSYDSDHLISVAIRHQDTDKGITEGEPVDRLTIHSDIINGLFYITIYSGKESWKKGHKIQTFSIGGNPYIRIDENKVKLDYLGDLPEGPIVKSESVKELEFQPEPTPEPPSSPRGSLPKGFTKELHQEPEPTPEPTPKEEKATTQQIAQLDNLQKQIDELEKEIKKSKSTHIKRKITKPKKQLKSSTKKITSKSKSSEIYCARCKTKRKIKNPKKTTMKNGRAAVKGFCSVCNCKVSRVVKIEK